MKHIFIVNPVAGKVDKSDTVRIMVENLNVDIEYQIYCTKAPGDATRFVKKMCETGEEIRFYACGGDGTLNEVASGTVGFDNASVTVLPCGSGNDFIKYYGTKEDFLNINDLVNGAQTKIDVIKVCGRYAINAVHFGLDTAVLKTMLKVRRKKIIGGKNAYNTGVVTALINGMKTKCIITADGEKIGNDCILLCTIANGKYVGGKYKCAPRSLNDDGFMELCHVKPISRFNFLRLMGTYEKGKHLDDKRFIKYISYKRCKSVEIKAEPNSDFCISIDGELTYSNDIKVEIVEKAINFVIPQNLAKCHLIESEEKTIVS